MPQINNKHFFPIGAKKKNYLTDNDIKLLRVRYGIIKTEPLAIVPFVKEWTGAKEAGKDSVGIYYKF